jgi:Flp pilus assembly protein TadD
MRPLAYLSAFIILLGFLGLENVTANCADEYFGDYHSLYLADINHPCPNDYTYAEYNLYGEGDGNFNLYILDSWNNTWYSSKTTADNEYLKVPIHCGYSHKAYVWAYSGSGSWNVCSPQVTFGEGFRQIADSDTAPDAAATTNTTSTSSGSVSSGVVGRWTLTFDWDCDGSSDEAKIMFNSDGTFDEEESLNEGEWSKDGQSVRWEHYADPNALYRGSLAGLFMSGTMSTTDGRTGCWTAKKDAGAPDVQGSEGSTGETASETTTIQSAISTNILDHSMASNVDLSTNNATTRTDKFYDTDSKAYSWLSLGNVETGIVEWIWYSPDGNRYYTNSLDIPQPISGDYWVVYNLWDSIHIARNDAVDYPGNWHVDVYLDGQKLFTEEFSIQGDQQRGTADNWVDEGNTLYAHGKYDEAIQAYDKAIEINPQDADAWYYKGTALDMLRKYDEAIQAFDRAIEINPQDADAWYEKGWNLGELGKHEEAIEALDEAIRLDPNYASAWEDKGWNLGELGKHEEAIQALDKAIDIDPQYAYAWLIRGRVLYNQGKYDEAIQAYDKAIEINSQDADAWYGKTLALDEQGKHDEANRTYDKAIEINPEIEEEWWWY